jgi:DNA polymerase-3 subunit delta'
VISPLLQAAHAPMWEKIQQACQRHRMPQALLLVGPQHLWIGGFANRLAAMLLCHHDNAPCGSCTACHLGQAGTHPDLQTIRPDTDGGVIKIEKIRALQQVAYHTPQCGQCVVIVIEQADKMNMASANALLKILEEPPPHVYFVLVAERWTVIPATILSRCQRIVFPDLRLDSLQYVALGKHYLEGSSRQILYTQRDAIVRALCEIAEGRISPCTVASQWATTDLADVMWIMYLIMAQAIQNRALNHTAPASDHDALLHFAQLFSLAQLFHQFDNLRSILKNMSHNISINPTLALESILIGFVKH